MSRLHRLYDDYDVEAAHQKMVEDLEEADLERLITTGKVKGMYRTATTKSENKADDTCLLESQIYMAYADKGSMPRTERKRATSKHQKNLNDKNSRRAFVRIAIANFGTGDYYATYGWDRDHLPADIEEAEKQVRAYFRRVNYRRKKKGLENAKYMYILAVDEYTRPHVHILIQSAGMDRDELEDLWTMCERKNTRRIAPDDDYLITGLATYIARNPRGTKRWRCSKGLERPETTKSYSKFRRRKVERMVRDEEYLRKEMEKTYPGFSFLDAEVRYNGINAAFYIYVRMIRRKLKNKDKPRKGGRRH